MKKSVFALIAPALLLAGSANAWTNLSAPNSWGAISIGSTSSVYGEPGPDSGYPWIISGQPAAGDTSNNYIYKYNVSTASWQLMPNAARQITVASDGIPWVLRADGSIYKWTGSSFTQPNGIGSYNGASSCAQEISVGLFNFAWIVSCSPNADSPLFYFDGAHWNPTSFSAKHVFHFDDDSGSSVTWAVKSNGDIYSQGSTGTWTLTGGGGGSFGSTNSIVPLCIDVAANAAWKFSSGTWSAYESAPTGKTLKQLTVGWAITTDGEIWEL